MWDGVEAKANLNVSRTHRRTWSLGGLNVQSIFVEGELQSQRWVRWIVRGYEQGVGEVVQFGLDPDRARARYAK
jgi:hypothetical protein